MAASLQRPPADYSRQSQAPTGMNGVTRSSSQRQRNGQGRGRNDLDYQLSPTAPAAPEVPREPPVSYRGSAQTASPMTSTVPKSFSERLRANPRNDLTGQDDLKVYDEPIPGNGAEIKKAYTRNRRAEMDSDNNGHPGSSSIPVRRRSARQTGADPQSPQQHATPRDLPPLDTNSTTRSVDSKQRSTNPTTSASRSKSVRQTQRLAEDDEEGGDWAHRSPLQKLELKLNDISKEEKRARVLEAEMLYKLGQNGNRRVSREGQPSTSRHLDKSRSQKQGNGPDESMTTDGSMSQTRSTAERSRSNRDQGPDSRKSSIEPRTTNYAKPTVREPARDVPRTSTHVEAATIPLQRHPAHEPRTTGKRPAVYHNSPTTSYDDPSMERYPVSQEGVGRSTSARQARAERLEQTIPSNITRAVSLQGQRPPAKFQDDEGLEPSRPGQLNHSHKAALAAGTTAGAIAGTQAAASGLGRSNSKKLQKAPPKRAQDPNIRTSAEDFQDPTAHPAAQVADQTGQYYSRGAPKEIDIQRSSSTSKRTQPTGPTAAAAAPVGLGLDRDSIDKPEHHRHHGLSDMFHNRPRQQSISFKQAFDRARPIDEWKNAGVASLTLKDMDLESEDNPDKNKAWWEGGSSARRRSKRSSGTTGAYDGVADDTRQPVFEPRLFLKCGPLLRYTGLRKVRVEKPGRSGEMETWRGTVMIVTEDAQSSYEQVPTLRLFSQPMSLLPPPPDRIDDDDGELAPEYVDPLAGLTAISRTGKSRYVRPIDHIEPEKDLSRIEDDNGLFENSPSLIDLPDGRSIKSPNNRARGIDGEKGGKFKEVKGHRLHTDLERGVTFWRFYLEIELGEEQAHVAYRINRGAPIGFWVPARGHSMNVMFHSCNGFSLSVKPDEFSGPDPLWRDVLNTHQSRPFHVMIGGGDQIYNDRVMIETTHFAEWLRMKNPHEKHHTEFTPEMAHELETFYLNRYCMWFSQGLFGMANSQIPMVNVWDDHDIIDGFGSYPDHFMRAPVFSGLGNIAFRYYMLFQHQSVPEETDRDEPSWLLGPEVGPYITQRSRNLFMSLGKGLTFLGLDCRTERKRDEIMSDATIHEVLDRCRREIVEGDTKHLLVLLGVPIAYPRLVWLENVLTSRAMNPIKALGRARILKGSFLNKFDGGVEILDDLDDHWTASGHKGERQDLIQDLQDLAAEKSVRITILGGDVHLAAVGQFYTNPKYKIPKDRDHRYMPNVVSSAICNTPPGEMLADILNKRNKVHHFDHYTDEDMIPMFTHDVDGKKRNNKTLLPRRNWCSIREYVPGQTPPPTPSPPRTPTESDRSYSPEPPNRSFSFSRGDGKPGNLLRRLSLRGRREPPTSYRDEMYAEDNNTRRPASSTGVPPSQPSEQGDDYFSSHSNPPSNTRQTFPGPHSRNTSMIPRPGNFQRRPTNLSEKAAKKGGGLAAEEEEGFNDRINLEGGLDIILNCEVSPKDPAGITTPYRFLVPALLYDGSSDEMYAGAEEAAPAGVKRSGSIFKKIGFSGRRGPKNSTARNQGSGNWGQGSDTESMTDEEETRVQRTDNRRWSFDKDVGTGTVGGQRRFDGGNDVRTGVPGEALEQRTASNALPQRTLPQGYNGVDAWKDTSKKRFFF